MPTPPLCAGYNKQKGRVQILAKPNQDPLTELTPLLGIDVRSSLFGWTPADFPLCSSNQVWEHAYYLQYKNVRPDYLKAIWGVINWGVSQRSCFARPVGSSH